MTNLYNDEDLIIAKHNRKKSFTIYLIVLAVFLALVSCILMAFIQLPYEYNEQITKQKNFYLFTNMFLSGLFILFTFIYLGIKHKRVKYYHLMLLDIATGQKIKNESTFIQIDNSINAKGNVDYYTMIVLEWSEKTQEYMQRNVLIDKEKQMPEYKKGDIINYITHANILLSHCLKSQDDMFADVK